MSPLNHSMSKNIVAGLGEIGFPISQILSKSCIVVGYDTNPKLIDVNRFNKYKKLETLFLHICIPFTKK